jgi:hypothetical protein
MRQSIISPADGHAVIETVVVGVTRVRLLPLVRLEWSLFCIEAGDGLQPMALAVYN